ncbi:hypothetical protein [Actinoplanes derwentensis]|uniref:DUF916 domain-containing protein n=1 Tax=Actinoplanes derwentensis TaxID=113562 RepID=A0A1H1YTG6_9ACTN|nr:hypothetical protein [Actinoplanes derwentensis]GID81286.1 hypothetical protein Ade03nite_02100 [Actinoplanes derwentensis]SDT24805.1 hypothetical protein SAMN04489716_2994 [Actinoplanes derwentensis]
MRRAAAVLAALAVLSPAAPAAAAHPAPATVTWTVQPATQAGPDGRRWIERTLDPGQQLTEHLAVRNLGDAPAVFTLKAADGYLTAKGRFNMLPSDQKSTDGGTWIKVPATVTVQPGKTSVVPFTITVPADALPGDHPAGIAASIAGSQGTVQVESRVGFRVLLRASGTLIPSLTTDKIHLSYARTWYPWRPGTLHVSYQVTNTGNTRLEVTAQAGSAATTVGELLPGGTRQVQSHIDGVWAFGPVRTTVTLLPTIPGEPTPREPSTVTATTWVMPWPQLLTILAVALLLLAWRLRRGHLATMLERAREEGRRSAV